MRHMLIDDPQPITTRRNDEAFVNLPNRPQLADVHRHARIGQPPLRKSTVRILDLQLGLRRYRPFNLLIAGKIESRRRALLWP